MSLQAGYISSLEFLLDPDPEERHQLMEIVGEDVLARFWTHGHGEERQAVVPFMKAVGIMTLCHEYGKPLTVLTEKVSSSTVGHRPAAGSKLRLC